MLQTKIFEAGKVDPAITSDPQVEYHILSGFVNTLREELVKAQRCLLVNDFRSFGYVMHKIKPNFMYLHLETGYYLARKLDELAEHTDKQEMVRELFRDFYRYCEVVVPEIENHLKSAPVPVQHSQHG